MRRIAVVTGARADYGIYRPVLKAICAQSTLDLQLLVCGAHLSADFGHTVDAIAADGFPIAARIKTLEKDDSPTGIATSMANGLRGFGKAYARLRPDLILVLGDRYEMFAAAAAALPFALPLAHIHGGEATEGVIDEAFRHAITKMSHLHFASTELYARRIIQMGEAPERVFVSGAPSLDNLTDIHLLDRTAIEQDLGLRLDPAPLLVTFHPVTLEAEDTGRHIFELLAALENQNRPMIFTYPNADTHGRTVIEAIDAFVNVRPNAVAVKSLGTEKYFSLMNLAAAMVGNSSSGIVEAASFKLPVIDIGSRQRGRIRARNVMHTECNRVAIASAIAHVLDPKFRHSLDGLVNPYGDGRATERIISVLTSHSLDHSLVEKKFHDFQMLMHKVR